VDASGVIRISHECFERCLSACVSSVFGLNPDTAQGLVDGAHGHAYSQQQLVFEIFVYACLRGCRPRHPRGLGVNPSPACGRGARLGRQCIRSRLQPKNNKLSLSKKLPVSDIGPRLRKSNVTGLTRADAARGLVDSAVGHTYRQKTTRLRWIPWAL